MKFIDISLDIHRDMIVYPGNPSVSITESERIPKVRSNNSMLSFGSHTGTHVDSKKHIRNSGSGSDTLPLSSMYGPCKVLDMTRCKVDVTAADLKRHSIVAADIILLKTRNSKRGYRKFYPDYVHVAPDAANYLVQKEVKTLGVDYLSAKKFRSENKAVHTKLIDNMTLFEGLDLSKVTPGTYTFIGLPLKIKGCDGAPARVILAR